MPIFLLLVSYVALEIYVLLQVWAAFGFINTLFALVLGAIFGGGLIRTQSQYVLQRLQTTAGTAPSAKMLQSTMIFIGGIFFIIPGFISDVIGLLFILPGTRHLIAKYAQKKFASAFAARMGGGVGPGFGAGNFRVFTFGSGAGSNSWPPPGARPQKPASQVETDEEGWARDVTPKVIDVIPLRSESHEIKKGDQQDD